MSVYVDKATNAFGRMTMCHMIADTPDELHAMADRIGVKRKWFQNPMTMNVSNPHYDICKSKRVEAIVAGAVECERNDFVMHMRRIRESGAFGLFVNGKGWIR